VKYLALLCLFISTVSYGQGTVVDVKVQGNKRTKTTFIKKFANLKPGQPLDSTIIERDIARLIRLPSIAHAYYQVFEADGENNYNVFYGIEENFTLIPFANIFTSNNDEFAFRVGLQEFNFLGQNLTLGAFYQYDVFNSYGLNIRAPYLFSNKFGLALNYQDLTTQEPVFLNNGTADYKYNNESIELLGLFEPIFKNRCELGLNLFTEDYQYLFGATDPDVPQE